MPDRLSRVPRWAWLLLAAILARAITFGSPLLHVDEEFYFVTAQRIVQDALFHARGSPCGPWVRHVLSEREADA